jgi:hypothetical protein
MGDYTSSFENIYNGGYSSMDPDTGNFIGYRMNAGTIGSPTGVQTANQLKEVMTRLKEGVKNIELQPLAEGVFDQIPKQHFEEIRQLMKLSGAKASVHAPIVDPAGFGQQGYSESQRVAAERQIMSVVEKSYMLDPTTNVPIVVHSSAGIPGPEYAPGDVNKGEERFLVKRAVYVDQETDKIVPVEEERKFYPEKPEDFAKGGTLVKMDADDINRSQWEDKLNNLNFFKNQADELQKDLFESVGSQGLINAQPKNEDEMRKLVEDNPDAYYKLQRFDSFLQNGSLTFRGLFNNAYKYAGEGEEGDKQRERLQRLAEDWKKEQVKLSREVSNPYAQAFAVSQLMDKNIASLAEITRGNAPQIFKPVEDFAMDKAAETFGNVAFKAYDKFGGNAPILAIENMYQGMAFSRAEDMKKLVEMSRKKFVENAVEKGMDESTAKKNAEKILGVTWDVGHLNMMRKAGFEEKDVVSETEKIAPVVKHVHLTDNFGYSDSHLAPGMGNVPIKQILEKLEKTGKLGEMRKIVEAGAFVQHFQKSPHPWTMSAFGSPIYGMKQGGYWNQAMSIPQGGGYFGMPLAYLPEKHFQTYGAGFSGLPEELGGQMPGTQSRFAGTPNA